jgi:hypothetical protein
MSPFAKMRCVHKRPIPSHGVIHRNVIGSEMAGPASSSNPQALAKRAAICLKLKSQMIALRRNCMYERNTGCKMGK